MTHIFVSPARLQEHLEDPNVVIVDGSWYLPTQNRDAEAEYLAGHIPGAVRFDLDSVKDSSSRLPHMLPSPDEFARRVGAMGIGEDTIVVVYDGSGLFSAPRVRWTFRVFGATRRRDSRRRVSRPGKPRAARSRSGPGRKLPPQVFTAHIRCHSVVADAARVRPHRELRCRAGASMPGPRSVSAARRRSRVPAFAPVTSRAASTFRSRRSSRTENSRTKPASRGL